MMGGGRSEDGGNLSEDGRSGANLESLSLMVTVVMGSFREYDPEKSGNRGPRRRESCARWEPVGVVYLITTIFHFSQRLHTNPYLLQYGTSLLLLFIVGRVAIVDRRFFWHALVQGFVDLLRRLCSMQRVT